MRKERTRLGYALFVSKKFLKMIQVCTYFPDGQHGTIDVAVAHAAHTTSYARGALLPRSGSYADVAQMARATGLIRSGVRDAGSNPAVCAKSLDPCMERREITRLPGSVPPVRRKRRFEKNKCAAPLGRVDLLHWSQGRGPAAKNDLRWVIWLRG